MAVVPPGVHGLTNNRLDTTYLLLDRIVYTTRSLFCYTCAFWDREAELLGVRFNCSILADGASYLRPSGAQYDGLSCVNHGSHAHNRILGNSWIESSVWMMWYIALETWGALTLL